MSASSGPAYPSVGRVGTREQGLGAADAQAGGEVVCAAPRPSVLTVPKDGHDVVTVVPGEYRVEVTRGAKALSSRDVKLSEH